jgi:hypothetical protein
MSRFSSASYTKLLHQQRHIQGLSGKYPSILNVSRNGRVTLMLLGCNWVIGCPPPKKRDCINAVEWAGALSWWSWSARSIIVHGTVHKLSQRRLNADWLDQWESDCSRMRSKVFSDWLPSYIKVTRQVIEVFRMDVHFPYSRRTHLLPLALVQKCKQ